MFAPPVVDTNLFKTNTKTKWKKNVTYEAGSVTDQN